MISKVRNCALSLATVLLATGATSCFSNTEIKWQTEKSPEQISRVQSKIDKMVSMYDSKAVADSIKFQNVYKTDISKVKSNEYKDELAGEILRSYNNNKVLKAIHNIIKNNYQKVHDAGFVFYKSESDIYAEYMFLGNKNSIFFDYRLMDDMRNNKTVFLEECNRDDYFISFDENGDFSKYNAVRIPEIYGTFLENQDKTRPSYVEGFPIDKYRLVEETPNIKRYRCENNTMKDIVFVDGRARLVE